MPGIHFRQAVAENKKQSETSLSSKQIISENGNASVNQIQMKPPCFLNEKGNDLRASSIRQLANHKKHTMKSFENGE